MNTDTVNIRDNVTVDVLLKYLTEILAMPVQTLRYKRYEKFRKIGSFLEPSSQEGHLFS